MIEQGQLDELKRRKPCDEVAAQWVSLRKKGKGFVGPCPLHSRNPKAADSTSFECDTEGWKCATCSDGGDVIKLVMLREGIDFLAAVEVLGGTRALDPEESKRADAARQQRNTERDAEQNQYRERERLRAWDLTFKYTQPPAGTIVEAYLSKRGLDFPADVRLRFDPGARLYVEDRPKARLVHTGPAMIAAIQRAGKFAGAHITWLDLNTAKGKAEITDPKTGVLLKNKKMRGSKKGGHIHLTGPKDDPRELIIGEGIEKVLAAWTAYNAAGRDLSQTAFWTSADLGNMGGKSAATVPHPTLKTATGRVQKVPGPVPDFESPGLIIPDSVTRLVLIGDSTSDRFSTECVIARAAARYAKDGREVVVAWQPPAGDFDDLLRTTDDRAAAIAQILAIMDQAAPPAQPAIGAAEETKGATRQRRDRSSVPPVDSNPQPPAATSPPPAPRPQADKRASSQTGAKPKRLDGRKGAGRAALVRRERSGEVQASEDPAALDLRLSFFPLTDLGNAERFRERNRGRLLWCSAIGWLHWDGKRWAREGADEKVKRAAHATVRSIHDEADALAESERDILIEVKTKGRGDDKEEIEIWQSDRIRQWARESESNPKLNQLADQADAYLAVLPARLDADPFRINVLNGTLSIARTDDGSPYVTFSDHDPRDLITKLAPVDFDPQAKCDLFDLFFAEVQSKPEMRRFLFAWLGLSLTGDVSEQRLAVWWGKGKNGKSVLMDTVAHVAGDYGETVPIETFLAEGRGRNAGQATPDLAILPGVRLLRTSEPQRGAMLDEALIKLATGGEPMNVRHLNRDYFKFYPQFKLTISGNYRPEIKGTDEGIWRRVMLVPWTYTVPKEKRDPHLIAKLKREGSGILNRLLEGLCDWLDNGLVEPEDVENATAEYRSDSDPLGRFLNACTLRTPGARVQASAMHDLFVAWTKANGAAGRKEWSPRGLSFALKERGYQSTKSSVSFWLDVELIARVSDFVDQHGRPVTSAGGDTPPDDGVEPVGEVPIL